MWETRGTRGSHEAFMREVSLPVSPGSRELRVRVVCEVFLPVREPRGSRLSHIVRVVSRLVREPCGNPGSQYYYASYMRFPFRCGRRREADDRTHAMQEVSFSGVRALGKQRFAPFGRFPFRYASRGSQVRFVQGVSFPVWEL